MARVHVPAGTLPVIEDGRLVGLIRPPRPNLTPATTTSKVPSMSTSPTSPYPTFTGSQDDPACPNIYVDGDGHVQSRPLNDDERAKRAAWVAAAARENADGTFRPADEDADVPAEAPSSPAEAPVAPPKAKPAPATPDASGVIYVPGKVCRDCSARIERKPGAGRPPAKCLTCRAKDAAAAEAKAARKAAGK